MGGARVDTETTCMCACVSVTRGGAAHEHDSWQLTERAKHLKEQHSGQSHSREEGRCSDVGGERGRGRGTTTLFSKQGGAKSHTHVHNTHARSHPFCDNRLIFDGKRGGAVQSGGEAGDGEGGGVSEGGAGVMKT